jgi:hypothetical protein
MTSKLKAWQVVGMIVAAALLLGACVTTFTVWAVTSYCSADSLSLEGETVDEDTPDMDRKPTVPKSAPNYDITSWIDSWLPNWLRFVATG